MQFYLHYASVISLILLRIQMWYDAALTRPQSQCRSRVLLLLPDNTGYLVNVFLLYFCVFRHLQWRSLYFLGRFYNFCSFLSSISHFIRSLTFICEDVAIICLLSLAVRAGFEGSLTPTTLGVGPAPLSRGFPLRLGVLKHRWQDVSAVVYFLPFMCLIKMYECYVLCPAYIVVIKWSFSYNEKENVDLLFLAWSSVYDD